MTHITMGDSCYGAGAGAGAGYTLLIGIKINKQFEDYIQSIRITMESFDVVDLIENNPISKLTSTYQNKLLTKIKAKFTESEQQLFVASFYGFLKYDPNNDFVIDLDDVWKWVGFSNKAHSKYLLEKHFVIDKDYTLLLTKPGKQSDHTRGGHNKEIFMLNVSTFKKFCLKAGTKKADAIHDYYIKLEGLLHEVVQEESTELKLQLEQNQIQLDIVNQLRKIPRITNDSVSTI